jgi:hypothetical protein
MYRSWEEGKCEHNFGRETFSARIQMVGSLAGDLLSTLY